MYSYFLATLPLNVLVLIGFIHNKPEHSWNLSLVFQTICVSSQTFAMIIAYYLTKIPTGSRYTDIPCIFAFVSTLCDLLAVIYAFADFISPLWFDFCTLAYLCCKFVVVSVCVCVSAFRDERERHPLLQRNNDVEHERATRITRSRAMLSKYNERIGIHIWTITNPGTTESDCPICKEPYRENEVLHMYECKHSCHVQCSMRWLIKKRECFLCKDPINSAVEEV